MKVKCVDDYEDFLTICKTYEVIDVDNDGNYYIINDINWHK